MTLSAAELTHTPPPPPKIEQTYEVIRTRHLHNLEHAPNLPHCFVFFVQLLDRPRGTCHFPERVLAPHNDNLAPRQCAARLRVQQHATRLLEREVERHAVQQRLGALDRAGP